MGTNVRICSRAIFLSGRSPIVKGLFLVGQMAGDGAHLEFLVNHKRLIITAGRKVVCEEITCGIKNKPKSAKRKGKPRQPEGKLNQAQRH